jgi:hypothetical protein
MERVPNLEYLDKRALILLVGAWKASEGHSKRGYDYLVIRFESSIGLMLRDWGL